MGGKRKREPSVTIAVHLLIWFVVEKVLARLPSSCHFVEKQQDYVVDCEFSLDDRIDSIELHN
jgi:hypothetical protein